MEKIIKKKLSIFIELFNCRQMCCIFEFNADFQKRITIPFIFSFILSWCIWNWEVVMWVLSHDSKGIENFFTAVWDYVRMRTIWRLPSVFGPLISAITYTLVLPPIIKGGITWFNAEVLRARKEKTSRILDKEIEKFLRQKK
jgi:uncharacterized protein (DUF2062 family)